MCGGKSWIFLTFLVLLSLMGDKTITRTQSFALSVPNSDFSYLSSILLNRFKRQEEDDYESSGEGMYLYLAHVIEQPNFRIPNPQYLQRNFCFDFF